MIVMAVGICKVEEKQNVAKAVWHGLRYRVRFTCERGDEKQWKERKHQVTNQMIFSVHERGAEAKRGGVEGAEFRKESSVEFAI